MGNTQQQLPAMAEKSSKKFSVQLQSATYQKLIADTLTDPTRRANFIANISSVVATNPDLNKCDPGTLLSAALVGESLHLSLNPAFGQCYMVPFEEKKWNPQTKRRELVRTKATFVLGYKGFIQLALRTGVYRKMNVLPIKHGELVRWNPLTEEITVNIIADYEERENAPTIGYYAMFENLNGFRKADYWSKEEMVAYADRFSQAFHRDDYERLLAGKIPPDEEWRYSSFWYKDFDAMASKTMLRQLIGKWGLMTSEIVTADSADGGYCENPANAVTGADFKPPEPEKESGEEPPKKETPSLPPPADRPSIEIESTPNREKVPARPVAVDASGVF